MKFNRHYFSALFAISFLTTGPLDAYHLDGLWRSERGSVSVHIEAIENGFKAKRSDQGIWYRYTTEDQIYYADRYGNYYEVIREDQLIWHDAHTNKRIRFTKVNYRNHASWNQLNLHHVDHFGHEKERNKSLHHNKVILNGQWYDSANGKRIIIEKERDGILLKRNHDHWEKYNWVRYDHLFRDRAGNTLQVIDQHTLRWVSHQGTMDRIYRHQHASRDYFDRDRYHN